MSGIITLFGGVLTLYGLFLLMITNLNTGVLMTLCLGVSVAKAEGFEQVRHLHAGLKWYNMMPCYLRESLAVLKLWLID